MNEQFQILIGNIVDNAILNGKDIIVNPTNPRMVCGAGVSQVIFKKAGVEIGRASGRERVLRLV